MAAAKPEIVKFPKNQDKRRCISKISLKDIQDIFEIPTVLPRFWVHLSIGIDTDTVWLNRKWKNPRWRPKTSNACISVYHGNTQDITEIPTAKPTFLRSSIPLGLMRLLCDKTGSGKIQDGGLQISNACISASRQDINEIPMAMPMFFGSSIPTGLDQRLCNQTGSG